MLVAARFEDGEAVDDAEIRDQLMTLLIGGQKLASHCLLERDDCTSGPAGRVS